MISWSGRKRRPAALPPPGPMPTRPLPTIPVESHRSRQPHSTIDDDGSREAGRISAPWAPDIIMSEVPDGIRDDDSDDDWTKEESAIFEMLDYLDSSFSATSGADETMGDLPFGDMSFAEGYQDFLRGECMTKEDSARTNSFIGPLEGMPIAGPNLELKVSNNVPSRDAESELNVIARNPVQGSVSARGSIRKKVAQEDLKKTMRRQMAGNSANEATNTDEHDDTWEMVERSMAENNSENQSRSKAFRTRSGPWASRTERAKVGRKEKLRSAPHRRPTLKSILATQVTHGQEHKESHSEWLRRKTLKMQRSFSSPSTSTNDGRTGSASNGRRSKSRGASKYSSSRLLSLGSIRRTFSLGSQP